MTSDFGRNLHNLRERFARAEPVAEHSIADGERGLLGFVVVYNTGLSDGGPLPGCAKGGTRIRPGLGLAEVRQLARIMALKNAAAGIPLGGAKSGLAADPRRAGFEALYRRFVRQCKPLLYEHGGAFGGFGYDMGAAPEQALWACDELGSDKSFTGKPQSMGGTDYDRQGIAGMGVAVAVDALLAIGGERMEGTRLGVHGLGALGSAALGHAMDGGGWPSALGDPLLGGSWRLAAPPSAALGAALRARQMERARQLLADEAEHLGADPDACLTQPCDVLVPCATPGVITARNAPHLAARYLVEGGNGPCDEAACAILHRRGTALVPDFIANPGGIVAAFVEMTASGGDKIAQAKQQTEDTVRNNLSLMHASAAEHGVSMRDAALALALGRLADAGDLP